jgi:periplasmic divalent cation tolerance protein
MLLVLTTLGAAEDAAALARTLVEERLAACVGVVPGLRSVYRWDGGISEDAEQQLLIKTSRPRLAALERRLGELHPFDLPEFIVLEGEASAAYGAWVQDETRPV